MKKYCLLLIFLLSYCFTSRAQIKDSSMITKESLPGYSSPSDSIQQKDIVDYLVKLFKIEKPKEKRDNRKVRFSIFPTSSNMSGGKTVFTSFNMAFLLGDIKNTNVSTIYFVPYIGTEGRFGFQMQPNIWLKGNSWYFTGEYFILNYPQYTWGLGGNSLEENKTLIDYDHFRLHQKALKGIAPHLAVGLGYALDQHYNIAVEPTEWSENIGYELPQGSGKSTSSGLSFPVVFDSRRNSLNAQQGLLFNFSYYWYSTYFGGDRDWQSIYLDVRKYFKLAKHASQIIALRSYYWTLTSGTAPYLDLPANRWEPGPGSASRGMAQNRYRSNALLYFESEYRFGISQNGLFGGVVFVNLTSASQFNTQQFEYWHPAAGLGLRVKFNKYSRTNICLDYGFSKDYQTVYLLIGEAF